MQHGALGRCRKGKIGIRVLRARATNFTCISIHTSCSTERQWPDFSYEETRRSRQMFMSSSNCQGIRYRQKVRTGVFGANMDVSLVNDGPVTINIDSESINIKRKIKEHATRIKERPA